MPVQPRTTACGTPGAAGPLGCFRRGSPLASESHRAMGNSGKALPGAGLAGPGSRDGGSPSRVGPGPGPSPGGLAGGWDSPSYLAAVDTGTEEPSCGGSQVFMWPYNRGQACGWDGNERCTAQPLRRPVFSFAGEDRENPRDSLRRRGSQAPRTFSSTRRKEDSPSSALARAGVSRCRAAAERVGERWCSQRTPADAEGLLSTRREGNKPPTSFYFYHNHYYHRNHRFSAHK